MIHSNLEIAALIGSRICHDLISPVGAISNGVELASLSNAGNSPELDLIADSVTNASARLRLFRVAFGLPAEGQSIAAQELISTVKGAYSDGKIDVKWTLQSSLPRPLAQAILLGIMCVEKAIPFGGTIGVAEKGNTWHLMAAGDRLNADPALWRLLSEADLTRKVAPADVQFLLLPEVLGAQGRHCSHDIGDTTASISF